MKHTDFFLKTQPPISAKIQAVKLTNDWCSEKLDYYNDLKMLCRPDFEAERQKK